MRRATHILSFIFVISWSSCDTLLNPEPVDILIDELALNTADDVDAVKLGLYSAFRGIGSPTVIAGDFTADMLEHNGTFNQYLELGNKQITSSNAAARSLWGSIYYTVYISNFILERLPEVPGVAPSVEDEVIGTAHFLRGMAYFIGTNSFGGMPLVTTTDIETNSNIPRSSKEDILEFVLDDFNEAEGLLPEEPINAGFVGEQALNAAFARYYLYQENWERAASYASRVINSEQYTLEEEFEAIVLEDFTDEAIFELGYTTADDPGTTSLGLNNLFVGRREIIPSNRAAFYLNSDEAGDRELSINFDSQLLEGEDNGWSVAKYGTADEDNNNIVVFRLGEMYLIRAEARTHLGDISGDNSAESDINILRERANAPTVIGSSESQMLNVIEFERLYELAYEGHRWYDLVRTERIEPVMLSFSENWESTYELWPIPLREIQNNPALVGDQNPGYN